MEACTPVAGIGSGRDSSASITAMLPPSVLAIAKECAIAQFRITERLLAAVHSTAEGCLARVLVDLQFRFGDEREDGTAFVPLHFSRAELGALAGTSTETVTRTLTVWNRDGFATVEPKGDIEFHRWEEFQKLARSL